MHQIRHISQVVPDFSVTDLIKKKRWPFDRIEDNRKDPVDPTHHRTDNSPMDRDFPEQPFRGDYRNPRLFSRTSLDEIEVDVEELVNTCNSTNN